MQIPQDRRHHHLTTLLRSHFHRPQYVLSSSVFVDHPRRSSGIYMMYVLFPIESNEWFGSTPHSKQYFAFVYFLFFINSPPRPLSLAHSTLSVNF